LARKLEGEVIGETLAIAVHCFIEAGTGRRLQPVAVVLEVAYCDLK
jgi:hypothetical protein